MTRLPRWDNVRGGSALAVLATASVFAAACVVPLGNGGGSTPGGDDGGGTSPLDSSFADTSSNADTAVPGDGGGPGDASASDGPAAEGATPTDSGKAEAGHDAATDALADAPHDAPTEATTLGWCASQSPAPVFCDDFDQGALATPWDQLAMTGGTATLDGTSVVSAPEAMLASVTPNVAASGVDVAGYKSFTSLQGVAGTYTLSFDVRIDAADESSSSDAVLGAIQLWNGSTIWDLELEVAYSSAAGNFTAQLTENGGSTYVAHAASQPLPKAAWTRVAIAITLPATASGKASATMSFGGTQVVSTTVKVTTPTPIPEIVVGPTYATPAASGWTVRYDDVTFQ